MADENAKVKVWRRFERKNKDGRVIKFRIQHLPEDKIFELIQFLYIDFIHEDNLMSTLGIAKDPLAAKDLEKCYSSLPHNKLSLICCLDNEVKPEDVSKNDIVAGLLLYMVVKDSNPLSEIPKSELGNKLWAFYIETYKTETIYDLYKIDKYLSGLALSVLPEYRRLGLAVELTLVRDDVCRSAGLKVCASDYTSFKSQNLVTKCGYKTYYERELAEIGKILGITFPDHTKMFKKMAKLID